ncbi:LysR family transcriptional regulator [Rahnella aquatilis]|uniref:LysR family transcriptional regulator n=1 Tax=Rahnella aquatilis TaxID=34038 RepID=UPI0018CDDD90|nr:LysR family transcriptional regulator [Rahnella aquatilis]
MGLLLTKKMKYFMVTMDTCNFSKAADSLCITRSPLSKVICEIEGVLGGKLFHRKYNELQPTDLALEWYEKIKPLYTELLRMESEIRGNSHHDIHIIFDASIPELIYRYLVTAMKSENIGFTAQRKIIDDDDIIALEQGERKIIISMREITTLSLAIQSNKWLGDSFGFLTPENWDLSKNVPPIYIWKDPYSDYLISKINSFASDYFDSYKFELHNFESTLLLHKIHNGKGMMILPAKIASLYNSNGVKFTPVKNRNLKFYVYHTLQKEDLKTYEKIRSVINTII